MIDTDGSKTIDREETLRFWSKNFPKLNSNELFDQVDKNNDGVYVGILMLEPGTYEYKLVVNGEWRIDENNPNFVPNVLGTLNSVIVVEPF